jgi:4-amino-4-deoxy-L-arabinose transferase-like glycosyltransferase
LDRTSFSNRVVEARRFLAKLWEHLWETQRRSTQVLVAAATILASILIGAFYADKPYMDLYPILLWLYSVIICFVVLYPARHPFPRLSRFWIPLTGLLASAFFLRVVDLQDFPAGFHADENGMVIFALKDVLHPDLAPVTINPFRTATDSQPILYFYILRLSIWLAGYSFWGARLSSVIAGALAVPAMFLMVNEFAGRRMAWLAAILTCVYHYHLHWSRVTLNNIWVTLFLPLALGFFLAGWRKRWSGGALLAGLSLGLTAYFYAAGYILLILMPLLIWQTWMQAKNHLSLSVYTGKMFAMALVVAAPLIVFAFLYPEHFFDRLRTIASWKPQDIELNAGHPTAYWDYFWFQLTHSIGGYNFYPETSGFYLPGIPFLIGFASILFMAGVVLSLYERKYFPLIWLALVSFFGGFMVVGFAASSHFIGAIPAICWLVSIPLDRLFAEKNPRWAWLLLAAVIAIDLYFYFGVYYHNPSWQLSIPFPMVEPFGH